MTDLLLSAATPEPLSAYLTGLGVIRSLAEHGHRDATAAWSDRGLVLHTALDRDALVAFFLDTYTPTPMVSPWNKGAGFRGNGKSPAAEDLVRRAMGGSNPRLADLREAMVVATRLNADLPDDKDYVKAKDDLISRARSQMPDRALAWIDASVTLTADGPVYPHILGTGGNLGRLDLSANVLAHLDRIIGFDDHVDVERSRSWLVDTLFGGGSPRIRGASVGQFEPGMAGGTNASSSGDGTSLANPWGFVLALEGSLLFASGIARRLGGHGNNVAAMPFTVRPEAAGAAHLSAQENAKGELWLPLWDMPATYDQLRTMFAEGRIRWQGRTATRGLDAARAVASLGADRGVHAFTRTAILERLGQNPLAIPIGRIRVSDRKAPALTGALDPWIRRAQRVANPPTSLSQRLRDIDGALAQSSVSDKATTPHVLRRLLVAAHHLEAVLAANRDPAGVGPAPALERPTWLPLLDDNSPEFRLAAALTSARDREPRIPRNRQGTSPGRWRPSTIEYLRPIATDLRWPRWDLGPRVELDLTHHLVENLAAIHASHALVPTRDDTTGTWPGFDEMAWVRHGDVETLLGGLLDMALLADHVLATSLLVRGVAPARAGDGSHHLPAPPHPAWRIISSVLQWDPPADRGRDRSEHTVAHGFDAPLPDAAWVPALARGDVQRVVRRALVQLSRTPDRTDPRHDPANVARGADGKSVAAALLFHTTPSSRNRVRDAIAPPTDDRKPTTPVPATEGTHA